MFEKNKLLFRGLDYCTVKILNPGQMKNDDEVSEQLMEIKKMIYTDPSIKDFSVLREIFHVYENVYKQFIAPQYIQSPHQIDKLQRQIQAYRMCILHIYSTNQRNDCINIQRRSTENAC